MTDKYNDPEWIAEKMFGEEFDSPIIFYPDGDIQKIFKEMEENGHIAPLGQCEYCDRERANNNTFFPSHKEYSFCRSYPGGMSHCTCDSCF